jgi:ABC-type transporter Mla subunit MlaD
MTASSPATVTQDDIPLRARLMRRSKYTQALNANTKAIEHLTASLDKMFDILSNHEIRISRLENK